MTIADWATTISGALAILGALGWVIKKYLSELKPNSGSSLRDATDRMERMLSMMQGDVLDIKVDLARLGGKVDNHIEEHNR
jgi:hypothetical protein